MIENVYMNMGEGIRMCMDCGYVEAYGDQIAEDMDETEEHRAIHSAFNRVMRADKRKIKKEKTEQTVFRYADILHMQDEVLEMEQNIKALSEKEIEKLLKIKALLHFNRSLKFWDYKIESENALDKRKPIKKHPDFLEYEILLWNTPQHIIEMAKVVGQENIVDTARNYMADRRLKLWGISDSESLQKDYGLYKSIEETEHESDSLIELGYLDTCRAGGKRIDESDTEDDEYIEDEAVETVRQILEQLATAV